MQTQTASNALSDLLVHALKDIYYAESAIHKALPKMIDGSENKELKTALTEHRKETEGQIKRLEQIFEIMEIKPQAEPCEAIKGILKEGEEILEKFGETAAGDAGVIFSCQAVEHYEINRYGSMREWAHDLGLDDVEDLLDATLEEEKAADEKLSMLAEEGVNAAAQEGEGEDSPKKKTAAKTAKAPAKKSA